MRLFASRQQVTADTPLDGPVVAGSRRNMSELSPAKMQASIDRALQIHAARHATGAHHEHELQPVVQVCPAGEHYPRWRKDRHRIMQRSSERWGTGAWADRLPAGDVAVVLLAYPAGRVGPALAGAKIAYEPALISGRAETRPAVELLAMQLVRLWVHTAADTDAFIPRRPCSRSSSTHEYSAVRCLTAACRRGR
jgi:hypothetical protein